MLTHRRAVLSLSLLVLFALVIAACGPQATPAPPATVRANRHCPAYCAAAHAAAARRAKDARRVHGPGA